MEHLTGRCACERITYRLHREPLIVHCCHCTSCQRETGTAFAINALIETANVELLTGNPEKILTPSESGRGQKIWRCPHCKVAVWSNYGGAKDLVHFVRVGTLDQARSITPDIHIYTRSKVPWVVLPEGAQAVEEYYDVPSVWPPESLERRKAYMAELKA
ncbi:GFA family protein [Chelativorans alearense]|uniref:GFA family protein n=1 Tax=Chelativorans alearense TaxID=2681495 RepID=UPI0013D49EA2|nr:GFA family protein [Chelativorans alearense]